MFKKIGLIALAALMLLPSCAFAANQWRGTSTDESVIGSTLINDIDTEMFNEIVDPLDRLLTDYRKGVSLAYDSATQVTAESGQVTCENSAGTIQLFRENTSSTTITWSDIDTGSEANSTTYYVYATCDDDETGFDLKISASSTSPTGYTYFRRLGSFYNNSSGDIEQISNDETQTAVIEQGEIAHGATISLPSGYAQDQCRWIVSCKHIVTSPTGGNNNHYCQTDSSRVVSAYTFHVGDGYFYGTANYLIACYK